MSSVKNRGGGRAEEHGSEEDQRAGGSAFRTARGPGAGEAGPREGRETPQGPGGGAGGPEDGAGGHPGFYSGYAGAQVGRLV